MKTLIIHQEKMDISEYQALIRLCPFSAIEEENGMLAINAACKMCGICVKKGPSGVFEIIEKEEAGVDKSQWIGIAVFIDHTEGKVHPVSLELIGKARSLGKAVDFPVYAVFIGFQIEKAARELLYYGIDRIYTYDDPRLENFDIEPYAAAFEDFIRKVRPLVRFDRGHQRGQVASLRV